MRGRGHEWQGACVAYMGGGGMCGGGMHGRGACMAAGVHGGGGHVCQGVCMAGGYACHVCPPTQQILRLRHTANERAVRILLECILV